METQTQKQSLAEYLRQELEKQFGSVPKASDTLGLPYERLKKALQRNSFSGADLAILLPEMSGTELEAKFSFACVRSYEHVNRERAAVPRDVGLSLRKEGLSPEDVQLIRDNRALAQRIVRLVRRDCDKFRSILNGESEIGGAT